METPGYMEEPFSWYRKMRQKNPVVRDGSNVYVFSYDLCKEVLDDFRTFSSQFRDFLDPEMARQLNEVASPSILILDPPRHTKLRNLVMKAFTPIRVSSYEDEVRSLTRQLLDNISENEHFDLVHALSYPLPVMVISRILGVPEKDMGQFKIWSDNIARALGGGVDMKTQAEMADYFGKLIEERSRDLKEDLLSQLIKAEVDGEKLTKQDIIGFSIILLAAGNETTTNLLSNSIITMTENPGVFKRLRDDRSLIPGAVEEVLRYRSPVQSTRRIAKKHAKIGNVEVQPGDLVFVYLASANRDENVFESPDDFIIEREKNRHIAFGEGIHFCLGAPLARLEAKVVLEELTTMFSNVRALNVDPDERLESQIMYGYKSLEVSADKP